MPIYPYSFQLPPLNVQDIPSNGAVGEFLGISAGGVLDWLPVATGGGDMLKSENLSGLANYTTARTNIGLGTASTPTFANLTLTSPSLTSDAPVTISQTWNNAAVVFTGLKVNAVNTASASNSLLLNLQVGGATKVSINKDGAIGGYSYNGFNSVGAGVMQVASGIASYGYHMARDYCVTWGGAATLNGSIEVSLCRDGAANTLALRNGAAAQTFRVYNTYTDANHYERAIFSFNSNRLEISTGQAGAGVSRKIDFGTNGATGITFFTNTTNRWGIGSDGHFVAAADNAYNIGANGANRPQNIFVAQTVRANAFQLNSLSHIYGTVEGIIGLYNNSLNDFNRLQFGGATDAFPAVARDGAGIKFTGAAAGSTAWIKVPPVAVSALPLAATAGAGARAFVNDALTPTFGSAVTGGGAVLVPVYSTGSAWNVG